MTGPKAHGRRIFEAAELKAMSWNLLMPNHFDDPTPRIRDLVAQIETASGDTWMDLLTTAANVLKSVQQMATPVQRRDKGPVKFVQGDQMMKDALPHVRAMARAVQVREKSRAIKSGKAALAVLAAGGWIPRA